MPSFASILLHRISFRWAKVVRRTLLPSAALSISALTATQINATGLSAVGTHADVFIESMRYDIALHGVYVDARMEVQFSARFGGPRQGILRFPLPPGAVIRRAELYVPSEDRWEIAQTLGRQEGSELNEEAMGDPEEEEPEDPLLIQKIGPDFYRAQVFPIQSATGLKIRVYYAHTLQTDGSGQWTLPIAQANRDATPSTPAQGLTVQVNTQAGMWSAGSWQGLEGVPGNTVQWLDTLGSQGTGTLTAVGFMLDRDLALPVAPAQPLPNPAMLRWDSPVSGIGSYTFVRWWPSAANLETLGVPLTGRRRLVFVIDVSGSMAGAKLEETKKGLRAALSALGPEDEFGLVAFSDSAKSYAPALRGAADAPNAVAWVDQLRSDGGTSMGVGIDQALALLADPISHQASSIVILTDGQPTDGSTATTLAARVTHIAESNAQSFRVYALGIGTDLDQSFLNQLVAPSGGTATFALKDQTIAGQASELFALTAGTSLSQARLQLVANALTVGDQSWNQLLFDRPISIGAKAAHAESVRLTLQGVNGSGQAAALDVPVGAVDPVLNGYLGSIAAPLMAKSIADQLERDIDRMGEDEDRVRAAVAHAKRYGIVTRYSSLLALDVPELYAELGIEILPRDAAGISLRDPLASMSDESQVGGEGAHDDDPESDSDSQVGEDDDDDDWQDAEDSEWSGSGCTLRPANGRLGEFLAWTVVGVLASRRRRQRGLASRFHAKV